MAKQLENLPAEREANSVAEKFANSNDVAKSQREQGVKNTVNKTSLKFMRFSQGFYYAQLLVKNTPFGKAFYKKLQDTGQTLMWERLYKGFKPVFLDKEGKYRSKKDRNNHEWNMQFLRDVAGNEGTSSIESLTDEIIGYADLINTIVNNPEKTDDIVLKNIDAIGRLTVLGLTIDNLEKTDTYKKYLKAQNGNVEPKNKSEWPAKARFSDKIVQIISTLSVYLETMEKKHGLYFNSLETQFISPDRRQPSTVDMTMDTVKMLIDIERAEYNEAKDAYKKAK